MSGDGPGEGKQRLPKKYSLLRGRSFKRKKPKGQAPAASAAAKDDSIMANRNALLEDEDLLQQRALSMVDVRAKSPLFYGDSLGGHLSQSAITLPLLTSLSLNKDNHASHRQSNVSLSSTSSQSQWSGSTGEIRSLEVHLREHNLHVLSSDAWDLDEERDDLLMVKGSCVDGSTIDYSSVQRQPQALRSPDRASRLIPRPPDTAGSPKMTKAVMTRYNEAKLTPRRPCPPINSIPVPRQDTFVKGVAAVKRRNTTENHPSSSPTQRVRVRSRVVHSAHASPPVTQRQARKATSHQDLSFSNGHGPSQDRLREKRSSPNQYLTSAHSAVDIISPPEVSQDVSNSWLQSAEGSFRSQNFQFDDTLSDEWSISPSRYQRGSLHLSENMQPLDMTWGVQEFSIAVSIQRGASLLHRSEICIMH